MRLTPNHTAVLRAIQDAPSGASYSYEIARATGQDRPSVSRRLDKLALKGLIEPAEPRDDWREENPRQVKIVRFWRLTPEGKAALRAGESE